jgi:phosphomethylpyrimidine synthase
MSKARKSINWEKQFNLAFDKEKCQKYRDSCPVEEEDLCSMCGEYCALKIGKDIK